MMCRAAAHGGFGSRAELAQWPCSRSQSERPGFDHCSDAIRTRCESDSGTGRAAWLVAKGGGNGCVVQLDPYYSRGFQRAAGSAVA